MSTEMMATNENLILLHQHFSNYEEAITALASLAEDQGFVDETYLPALLEREKEFPTGLEFPVSVAIPHIETGCKSSFVSIATLDEPVTFLNMDQSGAELSVRIVFVFGILDPQSQIEILRRFAHSFSDGEKIMSLVNSNSKKELIDTLNELLDHLLVVK